MRALRSGGWLPKRLRLGSAIHRPAPAIILSAANNQHDRSDPQGMVVRSFGKRMTNRRIDIAVRKKEGLSEEDEAVGLGAELESEGAPYEQPTFQAWLHNMKGERLAIVPLEPEVFDQKIRKDILHRNIVYLDNKERGWSHAKTLTRGQIRGTTKKQFRQKGMGRARRGTRRAPHFKGGGKAHGPKPRDFTSKLPKKVRKLGKMIAVAARYQEDNLIVVDELSLLEPKTSAAARFMEVWNWESVLFVTEEDKDRNFELACRNIPNVETTTAFRFDVKKALLKEKLVFTLGGLMQLQAQLLQDRVMPLEVRQAMAEASGRRARSQGYDSQEGGLKSQRM